MKIKELLRKVKEDPEYTSLDELSMIKKAYIEIGLNRTFSPVYYFGNTKTMQQIYNLARKPIRTADKADERTIICYSLTKQCQFFFTELGYECEVEHTEDTHVFNSLRLHNGKTIKLDLQKDLEYIQTGRRTRFFGAFDYDAPWFYVIPEDIQMQIDSNIGYPNKDGRYNDDKLEEVEKSIDELSVSDKIEKLLSNPDIIEMTKDAQFMQKYAFFYKMLNKLFEENMWQKVFIIPCEMRDDYTSIIYVKDKKYKQAFIYSEKNKKYMKVALEKIPELEEQGLKVGIQGKEFGVKFLKREVKERLKELEPTGR